MSNIPSQPRPSQPQSPSESWHTVPSSNSSSDHDIAVDQGSSTEDLIDLNPTTALAQSQPGQTSNEGPARLPASEKKKCWICLAEEGELSSDGAPVTNSRWAKACACSLDAHESCLIAWINQSRGGDATKTMVCPQCNEPYKLHQNVSILYKMALYYNKRIDIIAPFIAGLGAVGGTYIALTVHGWYALCTFCGPNLTFRIFSDENWSRPSYVVRMLFGMQFIPIWLLASRTRYLDSILPFIPLIFIEHDNVTLYPHPRVTLFPTPRYETLPPALTVCILPWLRIVYNKLWGRFVVPWEKKWDDGYASEPNEIVVHIENGNAQAANAPARAGRDNDAIRMGPVVEEEDPALLATSLSALCRKVVGAILLPDVCSFAGFLLGQIPWVKRKIPDRFSRNVIGGIVFLFMKDAASLWFKYSAYKSRKSLRILDYTPRNRRGGRNQAR